ncbi:MAG: polysaccharide biosynthesis tyrosine autokinase [Verrucomicrobia bacterium]|nr:polysaccharide biosynthesis tyrosine autokinase [Verrucomicrobiota bacterium]
MATRNQDARAASSEGASEAKLHALDYWRVIRVRFGVVLLAFLLVLLTTGITTYFMPRQYRSTVSMELKYESETMKVFDQNRAGGLDPRFAPTQFEIIQRKEVLYPVIDKLKLVQRFSQDYGTSISKEQAYLRLRNLLGLKQVRNTEVLDLSVTYTDPQSAAEMVNAVAESYQAKKREQKQDVTSSSLTQLQGQVESQKQKVNELQTRLAKMREADPTIIDNDNDRSIGVEDPRRQVVASKEEELGKSNTQLAALTSQLSEIEKLSGDALLRAIPTLEINEPTILKIFPLYQDLIATEAAMLNSGLGPQHPKIKALRAQKDVYASQLKDQIEAVRNSLSTRRNIVRETNEKLRKQVESLREEQRSLRKGSQEYFEVKGELVRAMQVLTAAEQKLSSESIERQMPQVPAIIWEKAEPASIPTSPKVVLNMVLGTIVGLIVGIGLAFLIEYLDTSIKTMEDVESLLGVPVLAVVPKNIRLLHKNPPDIPDAEAYRILRTNIEFNRKSADANTISMVSGGPGEGKSTTLANLAYICAQGGYSVLICDADLRRPTQHKLFEISNAIGLTNFLTTNLNLEDVILPTGIENLSIIPSGILPADAVGILNSQRMSDMIAELKTRYDIIFFDSPPILGVSDGSVLSSEVDQSIIVVQHRRFPKAMLKRVKQAVTNVGGTVLGVVLNNVDLRHDPNYYYYTSYYNYYSPRSRAEAQASVPAAQPASAGRGGQGGEY